MNQVNIDAEIKEKIVLFQQTEITEYYIYKTLANRVKDKNGEILQRIAEDELRHYNEWKEYSGTDLKPKRFLVFFYLFIARIFGLTFAVKMLERDEEQAEKNYGEVIARIPQAEVIMKEEVEHEQLLVDMIDEERIGYIGSMVLGLNDALVELTGALAGFTLALQNTRIIGLAGLITGIAASLSMAASEYLSKKSEKEDAPETKDPIRASFYTGVAYIIAVVLLVMPFFLVSNYFMALGITLSIAILIILVFTYFVSIVKNMAFIRFFWEMVLISLGVAAVSFLIGWIARTILAVDV